MGWSCIYPRRLKVVDPDVEGRHGLSCRSDGTKVSIMRGRTVPVDTYGRRRNETHAPDASDSLTSRGPIRGIASRLSPAQLTEQAHIRLTEHGRLRVYELSKLQQLWKFFKVFLLLVSWMFLNVCVGLVLFNMWPSLFVLFVPIIIFLSGLTTVLLQGVT